MSEQTQAARTREINQTVRYTMWSVFRLATPLGDSDREAEAAEVTERGILVELPPGRGRVRFQIRTPHAIASVRGTVWATDVSAARTSVFVQRGAVGVAPQASRRSVVLNPGEGVDVEAGTAVPEVKRWGPQRAAALLARFGR